MFRNLSLFLFGSKRKIFVKISLKPENKVQYWNYYVKIGQPLHEIWVGLKRELQEESIIYSIKILSSLYIFSKYSTSKFLNTLYIILPHSIKLETGWAFLFIYFLLFGFICSFAELHWQENVATKVSFSQAIPGQHLPFGNYISYFKIQHYVKISFTDDI